MPMLLHKVLVAAHLWWLLLWANVRSAACGFSASEVRRSAFRLWLGLLAVPLKRGKFRVTRIVKLCLSSGVPRETLARNLEAAVALAESDIHRQKFARAIATLTAHIDANPNHPKVAKCLALRSEAHIWQGRYKETAEDLTRCGNLRPRYARGLHKLAGLAHVLGIRGEVEAARRAMALQCKAKPTDDPTAYLGRFLTKKAEKKLRIPLSGRIGVMFGAYHAALGHAILDPFHFYNLFRHRFDHLVLIHPPLTTYSGSTALTVGVLQQYIEPLDVVSAPLAPFACQNLGEIPSVASKRDLTFLCYNYWALNRMAYQARLDPSHPMSRGRRYLELPPKLVDRAHALVRKLRIDTDRPIVVLHIREHGYHKLQVQDFRNVGVRNYVPAIRHLIEEGYTVVRIGSRHMPSLRGAVPGLLELPFLDGYDPCLDAYFLERCRFMISSQSGPCSLARALGKPNLVVNAVYHHTMLPEHNELFVFKRYRDTRGEPLGVEELLARGCHLFDRTLHFQQAGVNLEDATADEILAATEEMLAGLDEPDRADSPTQAAFRDLMTEYAAKSGSHPLASRMTDYIGYALPEGRVSDAVCQLRPGEVEPRMNAVRAA